MTGFMFVACTPGRVDLSSDGSGGSVSVSSGGSAPIPAASGGDTPLDTTTDAEGGRGGSADAPDDPPVKPRDPKPYDPEDESIPCFLRGKCLPLCEDHPQFCLPCEHNDGCDWPFPYCDVAQQSCVECLTGEDCQERFGQEYAACSAGKCVQCQHEGDCDEGEFCAFGLCGECRKSFDCAFGEVCVDLRCVSGPVEVPAGPGGTPGTGGGASQSDDPDGNASEGG